MLVAGNQVSKNITIKQSQPCVSVIAFYASLVHCFWHSQKQLDIIFFSSSKKFSNLSFGRFSPSRGLEFEVSLCYCRRASKKSSLWFKCTTPRCSSRWFTCIFSSLIRGLSAFFDKDPYKNNFAPDNALTDEDRIQQQTEHTNSVIMELII